MSLPKQIVNSRGYILRVGKLAKIMQGPYKGQVVKMDALFPYTQLVSCKTKSGDRVLIDFHFLKTQKRTNNPERFTEKKWHHRTQERKRAKKTITERYK